ncbi:MAG: hypothetical protein ACOX3R_07780 [Desulfitobacteriia bacterium]
MRTINLETENIKDLQVPDDRESALAFLQSVKSGILMSGNGLNGNQHPYGSHRFN